MEVNSDFSFRPRLHDIFTENAISSIFVFFVFRPLVYTVSALLPVAYIIGLTFTLKTHSHIYDIHVGEGPGTCLLLGNTAIVLS